MANSSDPYVPLESAEKLTRRTLELLLNQGFAVQIITKSDLVTRDIDLMMDGNCSVSLTITTLNDDLAKRIEPGAPPPSKRLLALEKLTKSGIPCSVRIDPIIPGINDEDIGGLIEAIADKGALHVTGSTYKARLDNFRRVIETLHHNKEKLSELFTSGSRIHRTSYLSKALRVKILTEMREKALRSGMTFAPCREGLPELISEGIHCDGTHLIPRKKS